MPMYNLLEYNKNYRKTIGSLYNYCRDELNDDANLNFTNNNVVSSNSFQYKNKIIGNTYNVDSTIVPAVVVLELLILIMMQIILVKKCRISHSIKRFR